MRVLIVILAVLMTLTATANAQYTDYTSFMSHLEESGNRGFVFFTSPSCPPCVRMKNETLEPLAGWFQASDVTVCILDTSSNEALFNQYASMTGRGKVTPTWAFLSSKGKTVLGADVGFRTQQGLTSWMRRQLE